MGLLNSLQNAIQGLRLAPRFRLAVQSLSIAGWVTEALVVWRVSKRLHDNQEYPDVSSDDQDDCQYSTDSSEEDAYSDDEDAGPPDSSGSEGDTIRGPAALRSLAYVALINPEQLLNEREQRTLAAYTAEGRATSLPWEVQLALRCLDALLEQLPFEELQAMFPGAPQAALAPREVGTLPTLTYAMAVSGGEAEEEPLNAFDCDMCLICRQAFEEDDQVRLLPGCSHVFHVGCIDKWLLQQASCPLCRCKVHAAA